MRGFVLAVLILLRGAVALAGPTGGEAARYKDQAHAAFELGDYGGAIRLFEQAYRVKRDPRLLYNIALSYLKRHALERRAGDLLRARDLFQRFLKLVSLRRPEYSKQRKVLRAVRRLARDYLAEIQRLREADDTPPASQPTPVQAPASRPSPAAASRPSPAPRPQPISAPPPLRPALPAPDAADSDEEPQETRRVLRWSLYGVGAALTIAATVTGALALDSEGEADEHAETGDRVANLEAADRADRLALTTDILIATAATSLAVAVVLHLTGRSQRVALQPAAGGGLLVLRY